MRHINGQLPEKYGGSSTAVGAVKIYAQIYLQAPAE